MRPPPDAVERRRNRITIRYLDRAWGYVECARSGGKRAVRMRKAAPMGWQKG